MEVLGRCELSFQHAALLRASSVHGLCLLLPSLHALSAPIGSARAHAPIVLLFHRCDRCEPIGGSGSCQLVPLIPTCVPSVNIANGLDTARQPLL